MTRYSVQARYQLFVKNYEFLCFGKSMGRNIGKNISKYLISIYSQKIHDQTKHSVTDELKTASKRLI